MQYALQTDRLRPRQQRDLFFGFTTGEIEKMDKSFLELGPEETTTKNFCSKLAGRFNCSSGRAGKPRLKWSQVQSWFVDRQEEWIKNRINGPVKDVSPLSNGKADSSNVKEYSSNGKEDSEVPRVAGQKNQDLLNLEFEAKSSKDGAWYDVDLFLAHRLISGEAEVRVRFIGFGPEEDEWVNIQSIRERSIPLESSECNRLKAGDFVLCFQEKRDQAIYYDARIKEIQRKVHDIRGCRCLFLVCYDHDNFEEKVKLRRLCRRPTW